jgi:two-component system, LuxR family, response regulator FixJ
MRDATVHIVDDDEAVRKSLGLLMSSSDFRARQYDGALQFLADYQARKPECLLLDLRMPGMDGLALQRELRTRGISIPTIFLSGHGDIPIAVRALREGALDFVEKPFDNDQLVTRIRVCIQADAEREQDRINQRESRAQLAILTRREREVVDKLMKGKINKVIAAEMGISPRTVETHRAHVMKKLRVNSLSDLFKLVLAAEGGSEEDRN